MPTLALFHAVVGLAFAQLQPAPPRVQAPDKPLREHARVHASYGHRGVSGDVAVTWFAPLRFDVGFVSREADSGIFLRVGLMIPLASARDATHGGGFTSSLSLLAGYRPPDTFDNPWWHGMWPTALADLTFWFTREFGASLFGGGGVLLRNVRATEERPARMDLAFELRAGVGFAF